jgi:transposase
MYDSFVRFDNNQASLYVRMLKVKQKVSSRIKFLLRKNFILDGCFRTEDGAEQFGRTRAYISTARKNAVNIFKAIKEAFGGKPFYSLGIIKVTFIKSQSIENIYSK